MKKGSDTEKGKYVDSLTGRILALLDFVMDPETEDDWLLAHHRLRELLSEEYVERKDRK